MIKENTLERYLKALLEGNRSMCRTVIEETLQSGVPANQVYMDIIWPIMIEIERLFKEDRITSAQESFASRINRTIVDQLQNKLPRRANRQRKVVICSVPEENAELGGQMTADLFESDGWDTRFLGGSVNNDDIMEYVHSFRPDLLLLYGIAAPHAPRIRQLIDSIRDVNAFPNMRIMLSGGVFERAEGLWEEIGADLYASTGAEAVLKASSEQEELPKPKRTIKRRKRAEIERQRTQSHQHMQEEMAVAG
ncbi:MAG: cobalamin-dependent protein [Sedimentisphaerales bacterium]|nr:cobalamin-dependent protein [Sedimentisphaerales bacterium]